MWRVMSRDWQWHYPVNPSAIGQLGPHTRWLFKVSVSRDFNFKVPKREIFDCSDFPDFYAIKSSWVGDLVVKILTYYFNF
jgi:hypothetical protein